MGEGEEGKEEWRKGREEKGKEKEEGRVGTTPIKKAAYGPGGGGYHTVP